MDTSTKPLRLITYVLDWCAKFPLKVLNITLLYLILRISL